MLYQLFLSLLNPIDREERNVRNFVILLGIVAILILLGLAFLLVYLDKVLMETPCGHV